MKANISQNELKACHVRVVVPNELNIAFRTSIIQCKSTNTQYLSITMNDNQHEVLEKDISKHIPNALLLVAATILDTSTSFFDSGSPSASNISDLQK